MVSAHPSASFITSLTNEPGMPKTGILKRVGAKMNTMKRLIFLWGLIFFVTGIATSQNNYLIAKRYGDKYEMVVSKQSFATIFDTDVAPYLNPGSPERFT